MREIVNQLGIAPELDCTQDKSAGPPLKASAQRMELALVDTLNAMHLQQRASFHI